MITKAGQKEFRWHADELISASQGDLVCVSAVKQFTDISTDTRTMDSNDVFLALKGDNFDGHALVNMALASGKSAFIVAKAAVSMIDLEQCRQKKAMVIAVDNTLEALGRLAQFRKNKTGVKIAAITGSNGKTTTRAMTECIFKTRFNTMGTKGNFNNAVGLPLTLLRLNMDTQWGVVELGMNAPGEIDYLAGIAEPDIGAVINAGNAHLAGLGTIGAVADAKCELLGHIRADGAAVINGDDDNVVQAAKKKAIHARIVYYGLEKNNAVYASDLTQTDSSICFNLNADGNVVPVTMAGHGRFMVQNAVAAATIGLMAGIELPDIASGIGQFRPVAGRLMIKKNQDSITIIDDTYNANPESVKAAISVLQAKKGRGRAIAVIGDMLELGKHSKSLHHQVGCFCGRLGIDRVCATGDYANDVIAGALETGISKQAVCAGNKQQILAFLQAHIESGDWVLVKGSRGMQMETIVNQLMAGQMHQSENEAGKRGLMQ